MQVDSTPLKDASLLMNKKLVEYIQQVGRGFAAIAS
jgi:hypothetical protein